MNFSQDMLQMVPVALLAAVIVICLVLAWVMTARKQSDANIAHTDTAQRRAESEAASKTVTVTIDTRDRVHAFVKELSALER